MQGDGDGDCAAGESGGSAGGVKRSGKVVLAAVVLVTALVAPNAADQLLSPGGLPLLLRTGSCQVPCRCLVKKNTMRKKARQNPSSPMQPDEAAAASPRL